MNRQNDKSYGCLLFICIAATIIVLLFIIPNMVYNDGLICIITFVYLALPIFASIAGLIHVIMKTFKRFNIKEKALFYWAISIIVLPWICLGVLDFKNDLVRYSYDLPNGDTLTVWQETIIFESYTSPFSPKSNYIRLPSRAQDWEIMIDTTGHLALWISKDANKVKVCNPKYQMEGIYRDDAGAYWFRVEHPVEERMMDYSFHYDRDGIFSGAEMVLHTFINDSVHSKRWGMDFWEYHTCRLWTDTVFVRDSFIADYNQKSEESWQQDWKYCNAYYPDSTEYSYYHK